MYSPLPIVDPTVPTGAGPPSAAEPAHMAPEPAAAVPEPAGRTYWRSVKEFLDPEGFERMARGEFAPEMLRGLDDVSRRTFMSLMGASLALAGLSGCAPTPTEAIVPPVHADPRVTPGVPLKFASAMPWRGFARGVLCTSYMGRPIKVDGNPLHPRIGGVSDHWMQASLLSLYDPDRSQTVRDRGNISTWEAMLAELRPVLTRLTASGGAGLHVLAPSFTSPSLRRLAGQVLERFAGARWHTCDAVSRDTAFAGARSAFGREVTPLYQLRDAEVIVSLDADFLSGEPGSLKYAADFTHGRGAQQAAGARGKRLYVAECHYTMTGAKAEHRLAVPASQVELVARAIARELGLSTAELDESFLTPARREFVAAAVRDLQRAAARGVVIAGDGQPAAVHALAHAINDRLGAVGQSVVLIEPVEVQPDRQARERNSLVAINELAAAIDQGQVQLLVMLGGNPVYDAPADLQFAERLAKVPLIVHLSDYYDETSFHSHWHVNGAHWLESWGDARAEDGTASIAQPLIAPLYRGKTALEVVSALLGDSRSGYQIVQQHWRTMLGDENFGTRWQQILHDGFVEGSASAPQSLRANLRDEPTPALRGSLEVAFRPDPSIWDGAMANNGWLQELPKPLTKLTWENAILLSPATAAELKIESETLAELTVGDRKVRAPVLIAPGHAPGAATVYLGYGRTRGGRVCNEMGFNAYALRTSDAPLVAEATLRPLARAAQLAITQHHFLMEGRELVRAGTTAEFQANSHFAQKEHEQPGHQADLMPPPKYPGNAWGMVIDLTACIGCNACVVACQAENNIPVVGKEQVARGREMHWIRIDQYFTGSPDEPESAHFQPVTCMHCEEAPCELVCPVGATVHSADGLNDMVYNRCVGTRYCSNNCPYKVRRFNFLQYVDRETPVLKLLRNPEVTVRSRGVMEKCTYCVQRIRGAEIDAKKRNEPMAEGAVRTACQQSCPTGAIVFGNLNNPDSPVHKLRASPLNYGLLVELNTHPRTTYLAELKNPNEGLLPPASRKEAEG